MAARDDTSPDKKLLPSTIVGEKIQVHLKILLPMMSVFCLMVQPSQAAPPAAQAPTRSLSALSKEALLGFNRPDWIIQAEVEQKRLDGDYLAAKTKLAKLLAGNPDSIFLVHERGLLFFESGARTAGIEYLKKAIKLSDEKGEHYRVIYDDLLRSYVAVGDYGPAAQLLKRMLTLFPHSQESIARSLHSIEAKMGKCASGTGAGPKQASGGKLLLNDRASATGTGAVTLRGLASPDPNPLPPGWAYQFIARATSMARFKCTMTQTAALGDTGIVEFLVAPPNYDGVTLMQHENHNCFDMKLTGLSTYMCGPAKPQATYEKITRVGDLSINGVPCIQYKCQLQDDSSFDLITLTKAVPLTKDLVRATEVICRVPAADCLILNLARVTDGFVVPRMHTESIKKVKVDPKIFLLPPSYHKVKNMTEFMYASEGDMKAEDLDQVMKSH